jgi:hypothetical protein
MMNNLICFVRAVVRNSVYLLTSSIFAALVTVYEHLRGSSVRAGLFSLITAGLLIAALYWTWRQERERAVKLESDLRQTREELKAERAKKPVEEAQAKLLDAQREEIEVRKRARHAQEEHEERMKFLTAPDTGIRSFVAQQIGRGYSTSAFTADRLASSLSASKVEIEEALRILRSQGMAEETGLPGHWSIQKS